MTAYPTHDPRFDKPPRSGMPVWAWVLIVLGAVVVLSLITCVGGLMYVGSNGLETFVQDGHQVPGHVLDDLRDIGALGDDETLRFFYSDAMFDPRAGSYLLTDQRLVLYNESWETPMLEVDFDDITSVDGYWSDNWMTDSMIFVELSDGDSVSFPLSMENDGDHRFVQALVESSPQAQGPANP